MRRNEILDARRQRRRQAVWIDLERVEAVRLEEHEVRVLLGEAHHLVLDGRAVARPAPADLAVEQRRRPLRHRRANHLVRARGGPREAARHLGQRRRTAVEGEARRGRVRRLLGERLHADGARVEARAGAGLQAPERQAVGLQRGRQPRRRRLACAAPGAGVGAAVQQAPEERPRREDHASRAEQLAAPRAHAGHACAAAVVFDDELDDVVLAQAQARRGDDDAAHGGGVAVHVALATRGAHGGAA